MDSSLILITLILCASAYIFYENGVPKLRESAVLVLIGLVPVILGVLLSYLFSSDVAITDVLLFKRLSVAVAVPLVLGYTFFIVGIIGVANGILDLIFTDSDIER